MTDSFFERVLGQPQNAFLELGHDQRVGKLREKIPDLHFFFDEGTPLEQRNAPERTRSLAQSLFAALAAEPGVDPAASALRERIVTEAFLRSEADRDQNVYLGPLFTRTMTNAVPDLIFQPMSLAECAAALRWGRQNQVPVTLRGAASTAMGGAVPNEGGLTLDLSRLDSVDVESDSNVCVIGAGARLRVIHARLAERGLALPVYPSNLGGTLIGWFVTGGIGMNAFGRGCALDHVRAADVLLPAGEHVRLHDDGRLDVPADASHRRTLRAAESEAWFAERGLPALTLTDFAGSEGVYGLVVQLTVSVEKRPEIGAFLLAFDSELDALTAATWAAEESPRPANLKLFSGAHLHHMREVARDERAREWKRAPSTISSDAQLPWARLAGPDSLGEGAAAPAGAGGAHAHPSALAHAHPSALTAAHAHASAGHNAATPAAGLFVDFLDLDEARAFAAKLTNCPGHPKLLVDESTTFAAERFRPQQSKRLGPGLLAAEILMPASELALFLPRAARLARNAGNELDAEVYLLQGGEALVIAGYLLDHRRGDFAVDLMIAPALLDLAMRSHRGRPYVLGRWQSPYLERQLGAEGAKRVVAIKRALDPEAIVNRGVRLGLKLHGPLGGLLQTHYATAISLVRGVLDTGALAWIARIARVPLRLLPGPAAGRGAPAAIGARFGSAAVAADGTAPPQPPSTQNPEDRALHCVNCGECNSVCPIFHESKIRLPQMLTHAGEAMRAGGGVTEAGSTLLDLCMRCGNCEEVCQAGIPHLPLYQKMQQASDAARPPQRERHVALLTTLRNSNRYTREFLNVRPGGYQKRAPASLPGVDRFILLRAENDAGPAASCIHCGACVAVCPTQANREFEGADPRWITTDQPRCIGCGTCVEVCPANLVNGGQTLRVMEAPAADWFAALEEFALTDNTEERR